MPLRNGGVNYKNAFLFNKWYTVTQRTLYEYQITAGVFDLEVNAWFNTNMEAALASKMRGTLSFPKEYIVIHLAVHWKTCLLAAMHRIYTRYFKLSSNSVQWNKTNLGRLDSEEDGRHWAPSKRPFSVYIPEGLTLHHCRCTIVIRISPICICVKTLRLLVQLSHMANYT